MKASEKLIRIFADSSKHDKLYTKYGVRSRPTLIYFDPEGKEVGRMGARDAESMRKQFEEIAAKHTRGPQWMEGADAALEAGKSDSKPVVLVFADEKPKSEMWVKVLGDAAFPKDLWEKLACAKVPFKKDDEVCKKWKVSEAPTLLIVDNRGEEAKVLKTMKGGKAKELKTAFEDAVKKMEKK